MCCFSPVAAPFSWLGWLLGERAGGVSVSDTNIFARIVGPETQLLVYSMKLAVAAEVAMILPVPTPRGAAEDALSFVDLTKHADVFARLSELFDVPATAQTSRSLALPNAKAMSYLKVHKVGSFVASFVPSLKDFGRLEPRFRMPDSVWDQVPGAKDFGFAVFQLEAGKHAVHPMAFRFRTRDPTRLFFPTLHVHDGKVHETAKFDHALYYQHPHAVVQAVRPASAGQVVTLPAVPEIRNGDEVSVFAPSSTYDGVVSRSHHVVRRTLRGSMANRDTYISLAEG